VDLGTGDGKAVLRAARAEPTLLAIGVNADASALRAASWQAARPVARGGVPNACFLAGDAIEALRLLRGQVHEVRSTLPWGSLLRAVLEGERAFALAVAGSL
jgi:16S rRNA (adenine(1408)-N(1))-methyltransferase